MAATKKPTKKLTKDFPYPIHPEEKSLKKLVDVRDPNAMQVEAAHISIDNALKYLGVAEFQAARSHLNIAVHHITNILIAKAQGGTV